MNILEFTQKYFPENKLSDSQKELLCGLEQQLKGERIIIINQKSFGRSYSMEIWKKYIEELQKLLT